MNIAIFASGRGSNFSAIVKAWKRGVFKANICLLICDQPRAGVIAKAKRLGIKYEIVMREEFSGKKEFEARILNTLSQHRIDLIVMAGFMRMLTPQFVRRYRNRIINIHPSLLPAFKGAHAIKDAFDYGVRVTGVTVHFVDELMDHGPIILQEPLTISRSDNLSSLESRIHKLEHRIYPLAIRLFVAGKLKIKGRKVSIC